MCLSFRKPWFSCARTVLRWRTAVSDRKREGQASQGSNNREAGPVCSGATLPPGELRVLERNGEVWLTVPLPIKLGEECGNLAIVGEPGGGHNLLRAGQEEGVGQPKALDGNLVG